jgi:hypothetical protein
MAASLMIMTEIIDGKAILNANMFNLIYKYKLLLNNLY